MPLLPPPLTTPIPNAAGTAQVSLEFPEAQGTRAARTLPLLAWVAVVALACGGCVVRQGADMTAEYSYLRGELGVALDAAKQRSNLSHGEGDVSDFALDESIIASIALAAGDYRSAERALISAGQVMGSFPGRSQQWRALLGEEGHKVYLGDPYEQAMNSLYASIVLLRNGDFDNARAALKRGILADSASNDEEYQSDIVALYLLEALLALKADKISIAESDLRTVEEISPKHPFASRSFLEQVNTILVIDVGEGPHKFGSGRHQELAVFHPAYNPTPVIELFLDGAPLPSPQLGVDLDYQARTRGGREMDGILRGKAVFKDGAQVAGALLLSHAFRGRGKSNGPLALLGGSFLLASAAIQPRADTRHWYLLPAQTHLWLGHIPAGKHSLKLRFKGSPDGNELKDYRQVWHYLPFAEEGFNVFYFRADSHKGYRSANEDGWVAEGNTSRKDQEPWRGTDNSRRRVPAAEPQRPPAHDLEPELGPAPRSERSSDESNRSGEVIPSGTPSSTTS